MKSLKTWCTSHELKLVWVALVMVGAIASRFVNL